MSNQANYLQTVIQQANTLSKQGKIARLGQDLYLNKMTREFEEKDR
jgi:hypothetical protein